MRTWLPAVVLCLVSFAPIAEAAVPSAANSTVDPCLVLCPSGDAAFVVVVRDLVNNPVANSTVTIDFNNCPSVVFCPNIPQDPYVIVGRVVRAITDASGRVQIPLRGGGVCTSPVPIAADGVFLGSRATASYDQDGSLVVNAVDVGIATTKLGTTDPTADFNCDGSVTNADLAILQLHAGHTCDVPTPARPSTWGRVKTIYR